VSATLIDTVFEAKANSRKIRNCKSRKKLQEEKRNLGETIQTAERPKNGRNIRKKTTGR
jgi:hypothetical protein